MKRLILAVAILALAVSAPAAPARHKETKHEPLPDLIVTSVAVHVPSTGSTPYIQVYPDGHTTPFDVHVDVENIGRAAAPKTHLKVQFPGHALTAHTIVPALAHGRRNNHLHLEVRRGHTRLHRVLVHPLRLSSRVPSMDRVRGR